MNGQMFGIVGLEVMGRNIALNIERNGFPIAVYNRTVEKAVEFIKGPARGKSAVMGSTYEEFVSKLAKPRRILLMVKAGKPVDAVIQSLRPLLEAGDILIDGGNSLFIDTERRADELAPTGIHFFGMGVSGGEEGALWGPSLMPGGDEQAYQRLEPMLRKVAAKADDGACVAYCGSRGAGHFVKMVHNGIEYGDMELIAEAYNLLKNVAGLNNAQLQAVFEEWNTDILKSFLIEITAKVINYTDPDKPGTSLVENILDVVGMKGTGTWTIKAALNLQVPVPTIAAAVDSRELSMLKSQRVAASTMLNGPTSPAIKGDVKAFINDVRDALYCSKICSYAQGMSLLAAANDAYHYGIRLDEMARIWKAGCIIRAVFLDEIKKAFQEEPGLANLLMATRFRQAFTPRQAAWRRIIEVGIRAGIPLPAFSASLAYYDSYRSARLPGNLIQAQRDFFGAHTFARVDKPEEMVHLEWK